MDRSAPMSMPLSAAVLAGGMSRRMGQDKALLSLRAGDPPLAALVIERLRQVADDVFVVASNRPAAYERFDVRVVPDDYSEAGALGGIATAIRLALHDHCLVVACDMPFLNTELLRWMAWQPRDYDALVPKYPGESRQGRGFVYQTLHAIYGRDCRPAIVRRLEERQFRVVSFFPDVRVREVDPATVARFDPALRSFFNANTPAAVATAVRWLAAEQSAQAADSITEPVGGDSRSSG